jgi:hypothetical protein
MDRDFGVGLSGAAIRGESLQVAASEAANARRRARQGQGAANVPPLPAGNYTVEEYTVSAADGSEQDLDAHTVTVWRQLPRPRSVRVASGLAKRAYNAPAPRDGGADRRPSSRWLSVAAAAVISLAGLLWGVVGGDHAADCPTARRS